jgi:ABC-type transport system involved in cytochrome bd biosynthesis fused ATPase/permease subunit
MSMNLREKIRASTQWWHHDCELKLAVCDALDAKDAEIQKLRWDLEELLEALENLLKVHEGEGGTQYHAGDMARAAIAKAKGE